MKYTYLNLLAFIGFFLTYFAFKYGYFFDINNLVSNFSRSHFLVWIFFIITDVGGLVFISICSIFLIILLAIQGKYQKVMFTCISILGGLASQSVIKNMLMISRPENGLIASWGYSFPSGHTNMTTIVFLCFCFYVFQDHVNMGKRKSYIAVLVAIIIAVGLSRLYLNAHWVSDVLAGWFLGLFWATLPLVVVKIRSLLYEIRNNIKI